MNNRCARELRNLQRVIGEVEGSGDSVDVDDVPLFPIPYEGVAVEHVALALASCLQHAAYGQHEVRGLAAGAECQQSNEVALLKIHSFLRTRLPQKR